MDAGLTVVDLIGWLLLLASVLGGMLTYRLGVRMARRAILAERARPAELTFASDAEASLSGEAEAVREHHAQAERDGAGQCGCGSPRCRIDHPDLAPPRALRPPLPDPPWVPQARPGHRRTQRALAASARLSDTPAMAAALSDPLRFGQSRPRPEPASYVLRGQGGEPLYLGETYPTDPRYAKVCAEGHPIPLRTGYEYLRPCGCPTPQPPTRPSPTRGVTR